MIQYDAAVRYLEKNTTRKIKNTNIFAYIFIGIAIYFIILFFVNFSS